MHSSKLVDLRRTLQVPLYVAVDVVVFYIRQQGVGHRSQLPSVDKLGVICRVSWTAVLHTNLTCGTRSFHILCSTSMYIGSITAIVLLRHLVSPFVWMWYAVWFFRDPCGFSIAVLTWALQWRPFHSPWLSLLRAPCCSSTYFEEGQTR